jgi:serine/threonine protein kinase
MLGAFGEALVMDWGVARVLKGKTAEPIERFMSHHTLPGQAIGTIGYMSPEQMIGAHDHLGPASDVWSLGVILFEMLTVRRGFKGSFMEVSDRVTRGPLKVEGSPELSPSIAEIITRATSVKIPDRYPHGAALGRAVEELSSTA